MVGARLILCDTAEDQDSFHGKVRLLSSVPTAVADKSGRFEFRGFSPGRFTIIYLPVGVQVPVPNEISAGSLEAVTQSITPQLNRFELGTNTPYAPRPWGQFTLLKGHTFWSMGQKMRIWNATARRGQQGPYLEIRRGNLWLKDLADKTEIKFDAWSF